LNLSKGFIEFNWNLLDLFMLGHRRNDNDKCAAKHTGRWFGA